MTPDSQNPSSPPEFVEPESYPKRTKTAWELPIAAALCVFVTLLAMGFVSRAYSSADSDKAEAFLDQKLETLMLEVRAIARRSVHVDDLNGWDDGDDLVPSLSFQQHDGDWLDPDDPFSGNRIVGNQWLYSRRLSIENLEGESQVDLRLARLEIFRYDKRRGYVLVRERRQVMGTGPTYEDSARVLDLYVLAIQNSPMTWGDPGDLRARIESRLLDLEARNPGTRIRTHWITKLAYGRDPYYRPVPSGREEVDPGGAYVYPARYELEAMRDDDDDRLRFSLADSSNHALRLADEKRLFERRVEAGLEDPNEPTWRLLLEDLHANPESYRDAMILNLHGGTLPLPPLRNYSDAAKIPELDRGLRVVCHPEKLRFDSGRSGGQAEDVSLRVYAWRSEPGDPPGSGQGTGGRPIVLRIPGLDLRSTKDSEDSGIQIEFLAGGIQADASAEPYTPLSAASLWSGRQGDHGYELVFVSDKDTGEAFTEIRLHGTPTSCPRVGEGGLRAEARLYGLDYIPLPVERGVDFSRDLASAGAGPKNTARWRIRIPASLLRKQMGERQVVEIRTSIGARETTGPWNESRTWAWWTGDLAQVPITERFQYLGDPRHNPYADLCDAGGSFPSGYNWFFDDQHESGTDARDAWPSIGQVELADGWMGRSAVDLPRYFLLLRESLRRSRALFIQGPGPLAFSVSLGGEDLDRVPGLQRAKEGTWWSKPWLGELFPDAYATQWRDEGNLPASDFDSVQRQEIRTGLPRGTSLSPETRTTGFEGSTSLMNSGEDWSTFHHQRVASQDYRWMTDGSELIHRWSLEPGPIPKVILPFRLRTSWHGSVGPEWRWQGFYPRQSLEVTKSYLEQGRGALGFALITSRQPGLEGEARFLLNGFDPRMDLDAGVDLILSAAVDALLTGQESRMELLPVPRIDSVKVLPGSQLELEFDLSWPRSAGDQKVRRLEPLEERVRYRCLYSSDGGRTYRRLVDAVPVTPDEPQSDPKEWIPDSRIGPELQRFKITPTRDGEWIIRVEAWLEGRRLHHAYHQQRIFHGS